VSVSDKAAPTHAGGSPARTRRRRKSSGPVPYDFARPMKLSREHSRALQMGFETFARQTTTVLTSALHAVCHVGLASIEQQTYGEYVESLANPTYMTLFSMQPVAGTGVLEIPLKATMACVDHLLGGPGGDDQPERPLTEIEDTVVADLIVRLLAEMRYAMWSMVPLEPEVSKTEYSPQFAQAAAASDVMVVASFDLRQNGVDHVMTICLPFNGLLPYLSTADNPSVSQRERLERAHSQALLFERMHEVPIDVAVRFRRTLVDPEELFDLQVGDVVRLQHPGEAPLDVTAADLTFAHATAGTQGKRLACLVVAPPSKENR
jgi:flagellar motor switch protein FliM